jgi:hypothetical protein
MDYHVHVGLALREGLSGPGRTEKFTKEELKQRVTECCEEISLAELGKSIGSWKKRLRTGCGEDGASIVIFSPRISYMSVHVV